MAQITLTVRVLLAPDVFSPVTVQPVGVPPLAGEGWLCESTSPAPPPVPTIPPPPVATVPAGQRR